MKRLCLYVHEPHMKQIERIAKSKGLKSAQLVRLAIAEYLERNAKEAK
jgi:hypothetical protein